MRLHWFPKYPSILDMHSTSTLEKNNMAFLCGQNVYHLHQNVNN